MIDTKTIKNTLEQGILTIDLNRENVYNALNRETKLELIQVLDTASHYHYSERKGILHRPRFKR